jgi:tape measure domain-containing protein
MDFNALNIKIDPGNALITLEQAAQKLRGTEVQAQMTQAAFTAMNASFKSMAQAVQQEQNALARIPLNNLARGFGELGAMMARVEAVSDRMARQNDPLANGFGKVAQQMRLEQQVLQEILGPQQEYFDRLMALDKLQARNAISTEQYVEQVTRLNRAQAGASEHGGGGEHGASEALGKVAGAIGGSGGALLGSLAEGGVMGLAIEGVHKLIEVFDEWGEATEKQRERMIELSDQLTTLRNETQKFVDAGHTSNQVIAEQADLAHDLHSKLEPTIALYDAVREGSDDLNLTHAEQIKLTRTLGEELLNNNKPLEQAGGLMETLAFAMKNGGLSSMQFTTIAKQVPGVVKEWEEHFHLSQKALGDAVSSGKIGIQQLLDVTLQGGQGIEDEWKKHTRTVGQYRDELKETYERELAISKDNSLHGRYEAMQKAIAAAGTEGVDNAERLHDVNQILGDSFDGVGANQMKLMLSTQLTTGALDHQEQSAASLSQQFARLEDDIVKITARQAEANQTIRTSTATINAHAQTWLAVAKSYQIASDAGLHVLGDIETRHRAASTLIDDNKALKKLLDDGTISAKDYRDEWIALNGAHEEHTHKLTAEEEMLQRLHGAFDQANKDIATAEVLYAKGKISLGEYNDELARNRDILGVPVKSATGGLGSITPGNMNEVSSAQLAGIAAKTTADANADALKKAGAAYDDFEAHARDAMSGLDSGWKQIVADATDSGKQIRDAMTGAFSDIQQSIVDMVTKGKFDLGSLGSEIEQILVKLAVQQGTGALLGLIGGGMTGFDYMTPGGSSRYALPGFATGGDMLVGGAGAPDSKLAMFRVSPGESIHVRTPQQREMAAQGASGGTTNNFNMFYDPKSFKTMIRSEVMNMFRQNGAAMASFLPGR